MFYANYMFVVTDLSHIYLFAIIIYMPSCGFIFILILLGVNKILQSNPNIETIKVPLNTFLVTCSDRHVLCCCQRDEDSPPFAEQSHVYNDIGEEMLEHAFEGELLGRRCLIKPLRARHVFVHTCFRG